MTDWGAADWRGGSSSPGDSWESWAGNGAQGQSHSFVAGGQTFTIAVQAVPQPDHRGEWIRGGSWSQGGSEVSDGWLHHDSWTRGNDSWSRSDWPQRGGGSWSKGAASDSEVDSGIPTQVTQPGVDGGDDDSVSNAKASAPTIPESGSSGSGSGRRTATAKEATRVAAESEGAKPTKQKQSEKLLKKGAEPAGLRWLASLC